MSSAAPERTYSAFVSHASRDLAAAMEIVRHLESKGLSCWIAPRDLVPGAEYPDEIMRGIVQSKCFVVVLSDAANSSPHVRREIERAASKGKAIYPIRIENVPPSARLEYFLSMHHWVDAFEGLLSEHVDRLAHAIDASIPEPPPSSGGGHALDPSGATPRGARRGSFGLLVGGGIAATLTLAGLVVFSQDIREAFRSERRPDAPSQPQPAPVATPVIPPQLQPAPPVRRVEGGPDAEFFRPNVVFSNGTWGVHMPTRVSARFASLETFYSFEGRYWQKSNLSPRFFFNERPATNELHLRFEAAGTTYGPFVYAIDFGEIKRAELIREGLAQRGGTSQLFRPVQTHPEAFPVIANYADKTLHVLAVADHGIARFQAELGSGFWETLPADGNRAAIPLFTGVTEKLKATTRIGLIAIDREGRKTAPTFFAIDIPHLMRLDWQRTFDESKALECEHRAAVPAGFLNLPARAASVTCRPNYMSQIATVWAGVKRIEYGTDPQRLDQSADISPPDEDLVGYARPEHWPRNVWETRWLACNPPSGQPGAPCPLLVALPDSTRNVYARFHLHDTRITDVMRFAVRNAP